MKTDDTSELGPPPSTRWLQVGLCILGLATVGGFFRWNAKQSEIRNAEKIALSNVRQLAAAADQYFIESGATFVAASQLVGSGRYLRELSPAGGEIYPMIIVEGKALTVSGIAGLRTITYVP